MMRQGTGSYVEEVEGTATSHPQYLIRAYSTAQSSVGFEGRAWIFP